MSFLEKYIKSVQDAYPWIERLLLFLDNATSTNKNRYLISWAMEMVEQEIFSSVHICFLVAGHTKFTSDRLFASCSKTYNNHDVFNEEELGKLYSQHSQVNVRSGDDIHPWREALKASYSDIPGIIKLHKFLIVRVGNKVSLRVGERCYDPTMVESTLSKSNKLSNPKYQSYKESAKSLSNEKVGHIQQMCKQFIPSSRWPSFVKATDILAKASMHWETTSLYLEPTFLHIICDVSSVKVHEPPYVNNDKSAKTWPKVNFAQFLFRVAATKDLYYNLYCANKKWPISNADNLKLG